MTPIKRTSLLAGIFVLASLMAGPSRSADPIDLTKDNPNDWLTYHGTYKSYHFSPLDQINAGNVKQLKVAWMHTPGKSTRGLQSMPLGGERRALLFRLLQPGLRPRWRQPARSSGAYFPKLDDDLVAAQTHSPYNRGIAIGAGKLYVGTVDGRLIALDMATGKVAWDTKLVDSEEADRRFHRRPAVREGQGDHRLARRRVAMARARSSASTPRRVPRSGSSSLSPAPRKSKATWGGELLAHRWWRRLDARHLRCRRPTPCGGAQATPHRSTTGPAPIGRPKGPRPGDNLYTTSVIGLDPNSGKLKFYHQELPHDAWDFDSSVGEFLLLERGGRDLVVHPNKGGFVFVYDGSNAKVENVWRLVENINFVKDINPKTGELIGRRDLAEGAHKNLCPAIPGGISWNSGAYNPQTGLYYKVGQEWCMDLTVVKTTPILEPMAQLNIGADFKLTNPPRRKGARPRQRPRSDYRRQEMGGEVHRAAFG